MPADEMRSPGVRFPPPLLYVAAMGAGWALHRVIALPVSAVVADPIRLVGGWFAVVVGASLLAAAMLTFTAERTSIFPNRSARLLVARGVYRVSHNPMYVALAIGMAGVALLMDTLWILALIPAVLGAVYVLVVRREEAYLSSTFGDAYAEYCARVRRWL